MPSMEFDRESLETRTNLYELAEKQISQEVKAKYPKATTKEMQRLINLELYSFRQGMLTRH